MNSDAHRAASPARFDFSLGAGRNLNWSVFHCNRTVILKPIGNFNADCSFGDPVWRPANGLALRHLRGDEAAR
jgi:hypothetical protein